MELSPNEKFMPRFCCVIGALLIACTCLENRVLATGDFVTVDLNEDGIIETIELVKRPSQNIEGYSAEGTITVKSSGRQWKKDVGTLESSDMSYITVVRASKSSRPYIGLYSFGGAHSMTLDLYYFDGRELRKEMSILSDAPSIEIKDVDNDGKNEIIAKMRDYDKDPIVDSYTKTYKYKDGLWHTM